MTTIHTATIDEKAHKLRLIDVECDINPGIGIHVVGLADNSVKESLLRVVTALQSCGYTFPGRKVVINLAPADLRKSGSGYDLPIILAILLESGKVHFNPEDFIFHGELALDGCLRRTGQEDDLVFMKPGDLARDFVFAEAEGEEEYDFEFATLPGLIHYAETYWRD